MTGSRLVVFPDADPDLLDQVRDAEGMLAGVAELRVYVGRPASHDEFRTRIRGASALLLGWDLPTDPLDAAPALEAISFLGSGVSNFVDLDASARAGITVMNVPRYGDSAVAEHTLALMLAAVHRVVEYDRLVKDGGWAVSGLSRELDTMTLGVLGLGGIGARVAHLASRLGMSVVAWTRSGRPGEVRDGVRLEELDTVLAQSDVVSLHLSLAPETVGIVSRARLAAMKPGAILVNTARAELVDEVALIDALERGPLASAALDVLWREPPPAGHPLLAMRNVMITPHVGFATREASERMVRTGIENLVGYFAGEPRNVVSPPASTGAAAVQR
jgi:D-3-phosphoglycerate dehydrogenase / 2-oxoglutarate reductase